MARQWHENARRTDFNEAQSAKKPEKKILSRINRLGYPAATNGLPHKRLQQAAAAASPAGQCCLVMAGGVPAGSETSAWRRQPAGNSNEQSKRQYGQPGGIPAAGVKSQPYQPAILLAKAAACPFRQRWQPGVMAALLPAGGIGSAQRAADGRHRRRTAAVGGGGNGWQPAAASWRSGGHVRFHHIFKHRGICFTATFTTLCAALRRKGGRRRLAL